MNPETDVVSCLILSGQFERLNQMIGMEKKWFIYMDAVREYGQTIFQK